MIMSAPAPNGEQPSDFKLRGLRVLLIADEFYLTGAKLEVSQKFGCECHAAGSVIEGLWKLAENEYDLVVIDTGLTSQSIALQSRNSEMLAAIKAKLGIDFNLEDPQWTGSLSILKNGCRLGKLLVDHQVTTAHNLVFITGNGSATESQLGEFGLHGSVMYATGQQSVGDTIQDSLVMAFVFKEDKSLKSTAKPGLAARATPGRNASPAQRPHISPMPAQQRQKTRR